MGSALLGCRRLFGQRPGLYIRVKAGVGQINSTIPAYCQITDALRIVLVNGKLAPGDRLPSARWLASSTSAFTSTRYRLLAEEGWLGVKRRRAAVVISRATPRRTATDSGAGFASRLHALVAEVLADRAPARGRNQPSVP